MTINGSFNDTYGVYYVKESSVIAFKYIGEQELPFWMAGRTDWDVLLEGRFRIRTLGLLYIVEPGDWVVLDKDNRILAYKDAEFTELFGLYKRQSCD